MPVFRSGRGQAPAWCELAHFEIVQLAPGESRQWQVENPKEMWVVAEGEGGCVFEIGINRTLHAARGQLVDVLHADGTVRATVEGATPALLVRMCGAWGEELGGTGLFYVENSSEPSDHGDPVSYSKTTAFDRHYHDCDEYWIIYEGAGVVMTENQLYEVGPGDCVATGKGHHHDFPLVHGEGKVRAVFFETTLEGQKRKGHLWNHTHGPAEPAAERV